MRHRERRRFREQLALAIREGYAVRQVMEDYGVSYSLVRRAVRENSQPGTTNPPKKRRGPGRPMALKSYMVIAELTNSDAPAEEVARKLRTTVCAVRNIEYRCARAGIKLGSGGKESRPEYPITLPWV